MESLYQITTNYFCAGLIVKDNIVIKSAPILNWTISKTFSRIKFKSNYKIKKL